MLEKLQWHTKYNTDILEIDNQHVQLLEYLNELGEAINFNKTEIALQVLDGLKDYTVSHFAFEEALMSEAQYKFAVPHQHVHKALIGKVLEFEAKLKDSEDVLNEFYAFLKRWLINHIQRDDAAYVKSVKDHFDAKETAVTNGNEKTSSGWFSRMSKKVFG
ncbi:MAG: bacteriohemerythrin [Desulfotalea sp.]